MQTLLPPAAPAGIFMVARSDSGASLSRSAPHFHRLSLRRNCFSSLSLIPLKSLQPVKSSYSSSFPSSSVGTLYGPAKLRFSAKSYFQGSPPSTPSNDELEEAKLAQVSKRLEKTARYFKRLGSLGFWGQLVCTVVAAVILSFSVVITGKIASPATFYATSGGLVAAFISVFWSFGYIRLSSKLRRTANKPTKAPARADVVKSLKNGIVLNLLGMGAAILGMQATVGALVGKALTSSANPYYSGMSPGFRPVLALDVFLVQASANTILSHFLGLLFSLELLRSVTLPTSETVPIPKLA
ncbi:protein TIC 21, chloroplastic-like [Prosopis cineraria]|uniref:protein TIC 21, chloroplastic-like n=1 Tax=Prosopis cineraria TaxID=364024 RepID=UPI00240FAEA4|nr:protein TIC 21, chloroplastic-like [Prosopis cineraria]